MIASQSLANATLTNKLEHQQQTDDWRLRDWLNGSWFWDLFLQSDGIEDFVWDLNEFQTKPDVQDLTFEATEAVSVTVPVTDISWA